MNPKEKDSYYIDKKLVRASFGRASNTYDAAAVLQKQVREEMLKRLDLVKINPHSILDAGCGTGLGSHALQKRFLKADIVSLDFALPMLQKTRKTKPYLGLIEHIKNLVSGRSPKLLCADIEALPISNTSVDFLWSNLAIQWCNDLDMALQEFYRVLQPEGLLMFSTFGPDTLKELRAATSSPHGNTSVSRFLDMHDIGDAMVRTGFSAPVLDVEVFTLTYDNARSVMRDLKSIGAHNATHGRARGLLGRDFLKNLEANYEAFRHNGKLPATFEVVYGHAWRGASQPKLDDGLAPIAFKPRIKSI